MTEAEQACRDVGDLNENYFLEEAFVFLQMPISQEVQRDFWALNFHLDPELAKSSYDVGLHSEIPAALRSRYLAELKSFLGKSSSLLNGALDAYHFTVHKMMQGDSIALHSDARSSAQGYPDILCWLCRTENFIGRDFLYGSAENVQRMKPRTGMLCVMSSLDPSFVHGVSLLESQSEILTIVGSFDGR